MRANIKISRGTAGKIAITFPYDPVHVAKIKAVEGSKWHPKEKYWSFPHSDLMLIYSAGLRVGEVTRLKVEDINS